MARSSENLYYYAALALVGLGLAEDLTGALLIVGVLTSVLGLLVYLYKGRRKR